MWESGMYIILLYHRFYDSPLPTGSCSYTSQTWIFFVPCSTFCSVSSVEGPSLVHTKYNGRIVGPFHLQIVRNPTPNKFVAVCWISITSSIINTRAPNSGHNLQRFAIAFVNLPHMFTHLITHKLNPVWQLYGLVCVCASVEFFFHCSLATERDERHRKSCKSPE